MYKLLSENLVCRLSDKVCIVLIESDNSDYVAYRAWIDAGNSPLPADEPPKTIVRTVTAAQGGIALIRAGLMDAVLAAAAESDTPAEVRWAFKKATEWSRGSAALGYLAAKAGITEAQLDALFEEAPQIVA